ncbi:MAG: hypothetical protein HWN66_06655 [Candidatus Helarchaeota archaeon]|nr:hypothetical protein [Candidatus Helarchaeota archaeon]
MQAISHFLIGIIIHILLIDIFPPLGLILMIFVAFFSHFLVDSLARMTYHLKEAQPDDKFWVIYHLIIIPAGFVVLIVFWKPYWLAMGMAVLIDIYDWGFIRGIRKLKKDPLWLEGYEIHPLIDKFRTKFFSWLPDWNEKRYGVVPEAIFITLLLIIIYFI